MLHNIICSSAVCLLLLACHRLLEVLHAGRVSQVRVVHREAAADVDHPDPGERGAVPGDGPPGVLVDVSVDGDVLHHAADVDMQAHDDNPGVAPQHLQHSRQVRLCYPELGGGSSVQIWMHIRRY